MVNSLEDPFGFFSASANKFPSTAIAEKSLPWVPSWDMLR